MPHFSYTVVPLLATVVLLLCAIADSLQTVPNSPCEPLCSNRAIGNLDDDLVCLDHSYANSQIGRNFRKCISCQLNSTAVDQANNYTDVEWALLDLRFALSTCMFAFPVEKVSISSPCQITCDPLSAAIGFGLSNDTSLLSPGLAFCTAAEFDDTTINECAFCYGFIPQQLFLANFLQALHIACRQPPVPGQPFFPNAVSLFNESLIAGPSASSNSNAASSGFRGWRLALAIALPVIGGIVVLALSCWCCFVFTRRRRQRMAQSGRMSRVHHSYARSPTAAYTDNVVDYQPEMTGGGETWQGHQQMHEMDRLTPTQPRHEIDASRLTPRLTPTQARWSRSVHGDDTAVSVHDDVGPGQGQIQDPNLHDQFFGVPAEIGQAVPMTPAQQDHRQDNDEETRPVRQSQAGPSFSQRVSMQQQQQQHLYGHDQGRDERGEWI